MSYSGQTKVMIATDRAAVPAAVRARLALEFDVVSVVHDADALLSEALRLEPDLVVVEAALSLRDGFRAAGEIMRRLPRTQIIHHAADTGGLSSDNEAEGPEGALAKALRLAGSGRLASSLAEQPASLATSSGPPDGLTARERQVLELLANGCAMKVIAHRLGITYRTVAFHKYKMMQRLGIRTNAGLTTYALRTGALGSGHAMSGHIVGAEPSRRVRQGHARQEYPRQDHARQSHGWQNRGQYERAAV
jgi:DNA-binding NarL/FixJ family response regulator